MKLATYINKCKNYSLTKPPVAIFVVCLILSGLTTLAVSFVIRYAENVMNQEPKVKWMIFLSQLSQLDFCLTPGNHDVDVSQIRQLLNGGYSNSSNEVDLTLSTSIDVIDEPEDFPADPFAAYGNIPIREWTVFENHEKAVKSLRVVFAMNPETTDRRKTCLVFTVPSSIVPRGSRPGVCVPQIVNMTLEMSTISEIHPNGTNSGCKNGSIFKMDFRNESPFDVYLLKVEKIKVSWRLLCTAYFLLSLASALSCLFLFKANSYPHVVHVKRMPLDL